MKKAMEKKFGRFVQLGKMKPKVDSRTFQLAALLKPAAALPVPAKWDFDVDVASSPIPMPTFGNDWLGDCVIAGRGHATLRFEYVEQKKKILNITEQKCVSEYQREGGSMTKGKQGLAMLDSLNWWRRSGWRVGTRTYKIHAFAEIARSKRAMKTAIRYLNGAYIGMALPDSAIEQFSRGQAWEKTPGASGQPNPKNGHCVYVRGYDSWGAICVTWGQRQQMSWDFFSRVCDEAYAIVDARDSFLGSNSPIDVNALDHLLANL